MQNLRNLWLVILDYTPVELVLAGVLLALFLAYSRQIRQLRARELAAIGILVALAAGGGAALRMIPGVQPTSSIIILTGAALGGGAGLCCGVVASLLFDLLSVFSIYTLWRTLLWGLMGLIAAYLPRKNRAAFAAYGFCWGFVFGWILNAVWLIKGFVPLSWGTFLASCAASFWFDLSHALCNAVLLFALAPAIFTRLRKGTGE